MATEIYIHKGPLVIGAGLAGLSVALNAAFALLFGLGSAAPESASASATADIASHGRPAPRMGNEGSPGDRSATGAVRRTSHLPMNRCHSPGQGDIGQEHTYLLSRAQWPWQVYRGIYLPTDAPTCPGGTRGHSVESVQANNHAAT